MKAVVRLLAQAAAVAICASSASAGFSWHRLSDFVPGTTQGSTHNNPGPAAGGPSWQYEWVQGDGLSGSNPWYAAPGNLMVWDTDWYGEGFPIWAGGDDFNPCILAGWLVHNTYPTVYDRVPLVRWLNPMGNGNIVDIAGDLIVEWDGQESVGVPLDVEVALAFHDASLGATSLLYWAVVSKPTNDISKETVTLPVAFANMTFDAGDSLIFTLRGVHSVAGGYWVNLFDDVTISQVPSAGSAALIALAGLAACIRRTRAAA